MGDRSISEVKFGRDKDLEAQANEWLAKSVGANDRSPARDAEKMAFEHGFISEDDLQFYDPTDDWTTSDSVYAIPVSPHDADVIEPTICANVPDGNVRARNPVILERQALRRHVEDTDGWGDTHEDVPLLGCNGDRKSCTRCGRAKALECFSPDTRNRNGLRPRCKECEKDLAKDRYARKST